MGWLQMVQPGDEYGFRTRQDGSTVALLKGREYPLNARLATAYIWKMKPDKK